jgi:transposase
VTYDLQTYKGRNVVERSFARLKQWRGLATR